MAANPQASAIDSSNTGNLNLAEITNGFNAIVDAKEAAIELLMNGDAEYDATTGELVSGTEGGDFEDTKTVLLMQQMMNEWSFTLGLTSSLTKTIADALKGIVQKI